MSAYVVANSAPSTYDDTVEQAPIITEPAKRHGVSDDDMLHALRNHARTFV